MTCDVTPFDLDPVESATITAPTEPVPGTKNLVYDEDHRLSVTNLVRAIKQNKCREFVAVKLLDADHAGNEYLDDDEMLDNNNGTPVALGIDGWDHQDCVEYIIGTHPDVVRHIPFDDHAIVDPDEEDGNSLVATRIIQNVMHDAITHLESGSDDRRVWMMTELPLCGVVDGWLVRGDADIVLVIADPARDGPMDDTIPISVIIIDAKATWNEKMVHWLQPAMYCHLLAARLRGPDSLLNVHAEPEQITWDMSVSVASLDNPPGWNSPIDSLNTAPNWVMMANKVRELLGPTGLVTDVWRDVHADATPPPDETGTITLDAFTNSDISRTTGQHCTGCELKEGCMVAALAEDGISLDALYWLTDADIKTLRDHGIDSVRDLAQLARNTTDDTDFNTTTEDNP